MLGSQVKVICPLCKQDFLAEEINSTDLLSRDSDFGPQFTALNVLPLYLLTCPNCFFTGTKDFLEQVAAKSRLRKIDAEALRQWVLAKASRVPMIDSQKFTLAAYCARLVKTSSLQVGFLYLKGSWCARFDGEFAEEFFCQKQALRFYWHAYYDSTNKENRFLILYLLGVLNRRLGSFNEALNYLKQSASLLSTAQPLFAEAIITEKKLAMAENSENSLLPEGLAIFTNGCIKLLE